MPSDFVEVCGMGVKSPPQLFTGKILFIADTCDRKLTDKIWTQIKISFKLFYLVTILHSTQLCPYVM